MQNFETMGDVQMALGKMTAERDALQSELSAFKKFSHTGIPFKRYKGIAGAYLCLCTNCHSHFYGDKRDTTCGNCELDQLQKNLAEAKEQIKRLEDDVEHLGTEY